jgi:hypothetical protein
MAIDVPMSRESSKVEMLYVVWAGLLAVFTKANFVDQLARLPAVYLAPAVLLAALGTVARVVINESLTIVEKGRPQEEQLEQAFAAVLDAARNKREVVRLARERGNPSAAMPKWAAIMGSLSSGELRSQRVLPAVIVCLRPYSSTTIPLLIATTGGAKGYLTDSAPAPRAPTPRPHPERGAQRGVCERGGGTRRSLDVLSHACTCRLSCAASIRMAEPFPPSRMAGISPVATLR